MMISTGKSTGIVNIELRLFPRLRFDYADVEYAGDWGGMYVFDIGPLVIALHWLSEDAHDPIEHEPFPPTQGKADD